MFDNSASSLLHYLYFVYKVRILFWKNFALKYFLVQQVFTEREKNVQV